MPQPLMAAPNASPQHVSMTADTLEIFHHLKSMIMSNAKLLHGGSLNARPRTYDIATSSRHRSHSEYRVTLVVYEENVKGPGKVDVESKILVKSAVKLNINLAMEDLLRKLQEELW